MNRFLVTLLLLFVSLSIHFSSLAQCPSGEIGVSGTGCGCLSGCNLTSYGGPNCTGTTGNCSAGEVAMSVDISVPSGCTYTVSATMANRGSACSASGADSGDQVKVDVVGGSKSSQTGASNATITDSYTLTGPGTIRVSGTANRADEIITYSTTSTGCVNCAVTLGIELVSFTAEAEDRAVKLTWTTANETNTDYFLIERSADGIDFEAVGGMKAAGNSNSALAYTNFDSSPLDGIGYYRIKQVDLDGKYTYTPTRSVLYQRSGKSLVLPNPADDVLYLQTKPDSDIVLKDLLGKTVIVSQPESQLFVGDLPAGMYIINFESNGKSQTERVVLNHK